MTAAGDALDVELRVVADPPRAAAELLASAARSGHVALSGGSTVGRAYGLAVELEPDWSHADVWFGDERAVPPDDERSNYGLVRRSLLDRLRAGPAAVHRVEGELGAEEAARRYDVALEGVTLDFALSGVGRDGHTASLFPGAPALDERSRSAVAADAQLEPYVARITMTPPVFAAARLLVYLVVGADKADAARRAFAAAPDPATPASLIRGTRTIALLDAAAGRDLPSRPGQ